MQQNTVNQLALPMGTEMNDDLQAKLAAAKANAVAAPPSVDESPDFPPVDLLSEAEILMRLEIAMYQTGLKVSISLASDSRGVWVRGAFPKWSPDKYRAGKVCFMASGSIIHGMEKLAQALEIESEKMWKPDQFAR